MRYRKRGAYVNAFRFGSGCEIEDGPDWIKEAVEREEIWTEIWWFGEVAKVRTSDGVMKVMPGDYIVRKSGGAIFPCKPEVFNLLYDECEENESNGV